MGGPWHARFQSVKASPPVQAQAAMAAQTVADVPPVLHGGTVYPVPSTGQKTYTNVDGGRIDDGRYTAFKADAGSIGMIPAERMYDDPVKTFAYGTDASFYRLLPQIVVKIHNEEEVQRILPIASKHATPVTFRAAGTSLSGQAVTDSILLKLSHTGKNFRKHEIRVRRTRPPDPRVPSSSHCPTRAFPPRHFTTAAPLGTNPFTEAC
jgi:D-lactate dehydrogenase